MSELLTTAERDLRDEVAHLEACNEQLRIADGENIRDIKRQKLELAKLRDAFDDAVALLRDWEDYDPADPECGWQKRRDEFLAEHEEAGR